MKKKLIILGVFFNLLVLGATPVSADVKAILKLKKRFGLASAGRYFIPKKRIKAKSDNSITENTQVISAKLVGPFSFKSKELSEMTISLNPLGLSSEVNPRVTSLGVTVSSLEFENSTRIKFRIKNLKKIPTENGYIYSGLVDDSLLSAKGRFRIKVDDL